MDAIITWIILLSISIVSTTERSSIGPEKGGNCFFLFQNNSALCLQNWCYNERGYEKTASKYVNRYVTVPLQQIPLIFLYNYKPQSFSTTDILCLFANSERGGTSCVRYDG